jgi:cobalt/nickel transport system permease protein
MLILHVSAFQLDVDSARSSIWHSLAPRTRILCVLLLVFATGLTPNGRWWTWAIYAIGVLALLLVSRVSLLVLLRRVAVEFTFVGVVLIGTLFRSEGEILWQWGWLTISTGGLMVLGSVMLKALLSLLVLNLLVLTTSIPALLHSLVSLRVPPLLVAILASMYRYIAVLADEFNSMKRAALSRNLMNSSHWQRLVAGHMIGALFIRTYERGDRIHQAMLARGYTGLPPVGEIPHGGQLDMLALTLTIVLALAGQLVYLATAV